MFSLGTILDILVSIVGVNMPADLVIFQLKNHFVILDMDLSEKYKETLDRYRGSVLFERESGILEFQGIQPTSESLVVSTIKS